MDTLTEADLIWVKSALDKASAEASGEHIADVAPVFRKHLDAAKKLGANENAVELAATLVSIALQGKRV